MSFQLSRRDFLKSSAGLGVIGASKTLFPSWMPRLAFQAPNQANPGDILVCIFLRGGIDGLNTVVPYSEGAYYYDQRPTLAVPEPGRGEGAAIDLDGQFGFHPTLAPLKEIYDEGDLAIVHATGSIDPTRSHFDAMQFMEYGIPGDKTIGTGWIGRHLQSAAWQNDSPFRAVGMGAIVPESLRGPVSPLSIQSIADFHFKGREDELVRLQQALTQLYTIDLPTDTLSQQAGLVFETIETLQALDATHYQAAAGANYQEDEFGMGLQQVAQLIKAEVGLEIACLDIGGWDTHENQAATWGYLLNTLARGLNAFYADLGNRMKNISVVVMSEFGRRVDENGSQGTDHGHGSVMFLMGGGVHGGQVMTRWPTLRPEALDESDLAVTIDYRDVLAEVLNYRMMNPAIDQIFPNHAVTSLGLVQPLS